MKIIHFIVISLMLISCDSNRSEIPEIKKNQNQLEKHDEYNSTKRFEKKEALGLIEVPGFGSFQIESLDSLKEHGGGDCFGVVKSFSLKEGTITIDSLECGEYGFTYRYILIGKTGMIQGVYTRSAETIITNNGNQFYLKEQIVDFEKEPSIFMEREDTLKSSMYDQIGKDFITDTLENKLTTYEHVEISLAEFWGIQW